MVPTESLEVTYVDLALAIGAERNPKKHDLERLKTSLRRFGFVSPVVMNSTTGRVVAGHGRVEALRQMQAAGEAPPARVGYGGACIWRVPVVWVTFATDAEAEAYLLADNRLVELGGWDDAILVEALRDATDPVDLGWSEADLKALLDPPKAAIGRSPEEYKEMFDSTDLRQIVLYFLKEDYEKVLDRLEVISKERPELGSHTDVFLMLLDHYEAARRSA